MSGTATREVVGGLRLPQPTLRTEKDSRKIDNYMIYLIYQGEINLNNNYVVLQSMPKKGRIK